MSVSDEDSTEHSDEHFELALSYSRLAEGRTESNSESELDLVIDRFELELGVKKPVELTRWYLLSVIRYLQQASWNDPYYSGLSTEQQEELAISFLSEAGAFRSLSSVLRKKPLRYNLVRFADKAETNRFVLSSQTNAFKLALELLKENQEEFSLNLDPIESIPGSDSAESRSLDGEPAREFTFELSDENEQGVGDSSSEGAKPEPLSREIDQAMSTMDFPVLDAALIEREGSNPPIAPSRRALRRNVQTPQMPLPFAAKSTKSEPTAEDFLESKASEQAADTLEMNEEEFSSLEEAMLNASPSRTWLNTDGYRFSTLAGVATGWGLFLFYLLFFT